MSRILNTLLIGAALMGFTLGGCGGNAGDATNAQVSAAVRSSADELESHPSGDDGTRVPRFLSLLGELRDVPALAPLFDLYQVPNPIVTSDDDQAAGLIQLLGAVRIATSSGTVTITNRQTGGVIYSAPLTALDSGTFHPENLPAGSTPACTYAYSDWSACVNGTQTRTVVSASPAGCAGTPVLTQACTGTTTPPPATCSSFTYSAWGACQSDGTQTRTVLSSSPSGCTGGTPATTQSCTYVPPVTTCTAFTYSAWGACQSNGTQTRTVLSSSPSGCTGGAPATTQSCTYVPPVTTCTSFTYSAWGACQSNGTQTRTVLSSSPSGCTGGTPATTQSCTYVPPVTTCTSFTYSAWGACQSNGTQTRTVLSSSPSGCTGGTPATTQACTYTPPLDGAALYGQYCSSCHGSLASSNLKGKNISVSLIKSFGMTQGLSDAQLQAIVTAVGP